MESGECEHKALHDWPKYTFDASLCLSVAADDCATSACSCLHGTAEDSC